MQLASCFVASLASSAFKPGSRRALTLHLGATAALSTLLAVSSLLCLASWPLYLDLTASLPPELAAATGLHTPSSAFSAAILSTSSRSCATLSATNFSFLIRSSASF